MRFNPQNCAHKKRRKFAELRSEKKHLRGEPHASAFGLETPCKPQAGPGGAFGPCMGLCVPCAVFGGLAGVGVAVVATQKRGKNARSRITVSFCITYIIPNVTGYPFWVGRFTLKYGRFWG